MDCIGLVHVHKKNNRVTRFAVTSLLGNLLITRQDFDKDFRNSIVVEKDMKLYAYTQNMGFLESFLSKFFGKLKQ